MITKYCMEHEASGFLSKENTALGSITVWYITQEYNSLVQ